MFQHYDRAGAGTVWACSSILYKDWCKCDNSQLQLSVQSLKIESTACTIPNIFSFTLPDRRQPLPSKKRWSHMTIDVQPELRVGSGWCYRKGCRKCSGYSMLKWTASVSRPDRVSRSQSQERYWTNKQDEQHQQYQVSQTKCLNYRLWKQKLWEPNRQHC